MAQRVPDRDQPNFPTSPACGEWETLLVDAMDGQLRPEDEAKFSNHMASCSACTEMFEQVRRGREWLEFLSPEPQVPAHLMDRILTETAYGKLDLAKIDPARLSIAGPTEDVASAALGSPQVWQQPGFAAGMRRFAEPRLLMTAAMAFFSIALTLSLTGVRVSRVSLADLKPSTVRLMVEKRIMTASTPIVRYYDHLRFVYEVESRMRELRRSAESETKDQTTEPSNSSPSATPHSGDSETHRKEGGSQLNPNGAPQQTVNPPSLLWSLESSDAVEAKLDQNLETAAPNTAMLKGDQSCIA